MTRKHISKGHHNKTRKSLILMRFMLLSLLISPLLGNPTQAGECEDVPDEGLVCNSKGEKYHTACKDGDKLAAWCTCNTNSCTTSGFVFTYLSSDSGWGECKEYPESSEDREKCCNDGNRKTSRRESCKSYLKTSTEPYSETATGKAYNACKRNTFNICLHKPSPAPS